MADSPHIVQLDETNFMEVVVEGSDSHPVLVDFWADWCAPCKQLMPVLEKLAIEYNGAFVLAKLDTEAHPGIAQQLGIRSLPTVKLFKDRQLVDEFMGALPESDVRKFLDTHVQPMAAEEPELDPGQDVATVAMQLLQQGDAAQARALLQQAQADDPANTDILVALGQVAISQDDLDTARSCLSAVPEDDRQGNGATRLSGLLALAEEVDRSQSIDSLSAAVVESPQDSNSRYKLAMAQALGGDVQGALDHLLHIVQHDGTFNDGAARKQLLALFNVLGDDPLAGQYRRKLFALLH